MGDRTEEFGELFAEFVRNPLQAESSKEPPFRGLVRDHLGVDPSELPVVAEDVPTWDHANLQLGLEALVASDGRGAELVGIGGGQKRFMALSLSSTGWPTTPTSPSC
jgi:cell division protease FtsH